MFERLRDVRLVLVALLTIAVGIVFAVPFFAPAHDSWIAKPSPATKDVLDLYWWMFWIAAVILFVVEGGIIAAVILFRERPGHQARTFHGNPLLEFAWTVIPAIIVVGLSIFSIQSLTVLTDYSDADLTIEVTGRQWQWSFRYPDDDLQVFREVHIPTDAKVLFRITSADVIHSFWVPALSGKMDAVPGRTHEVWLTAEEPGRYKGQCAEFCGLAHADMLLEVVAEPTEQFRAWVAQTKREQAEGANLVQLGQQVAQQTCVQCHSFEPGRPSTNPQSPNLSDYATRGPIVPQLRRLKDSGDQAWLTKWVTNAPAIKPGTGMPRWEGVLQPRQIEAVVAYLMTLK